MNKYLNVLSNSSLFCDFYEADIVSILDCLGAKVINYSKDSFILMAGNQIDSIGILLHGSAYISKESNSGERTIINVLSAGDMFAETLCCVDIVESPVNVITNEDSVVIFLAFHRILMTCSNACEFHSQLIKNMLKIIAAKNLQLQNRMEILSKKTLCLKILAYLKSIPEDKDYSITIPLNREELADYLCVDRSSLSHELSRMKNNGIIEYHKNRFKVFNLYN